MKSGKNHCKRVGKRKFHYSIRTQLTVMFIVLVTMIVFLGCFINAFFLGSFYSLEKKRNLIQAYDILLRYNDKSDILSEEFDEEMTKICSIYNINFIIVDADSNTIKTSLNGPEQLNQQLRDIIFSRYNSSVRVLEENDNYSISIIYDSESQLEYMTMWGNLSNDSFFMFRTAMDGIRNSVRLANIFLIYISTGTLILACVVIAIISKRLSDPIMKLAAISEKMSELDFEVKYDEISSGTNEIEILGKNFNVMSEKLEDTIRSLKNANMELQNDVENKNRVEEMRKEFMANVSHELKTPIALIQGYAEGLKEGIMEDQENRDFYCDVILDETRKMNSLVKQLMSLNQLEFGGDVNDMERFDLTTLIQNCISSDELLAKQNDITTEFHAPESVFVWADEFKTEQVFRNYFSNAVHYCSGEKRITITIEKLEEENVARVRVFNTGNPIPEEALPRLWEKFFKVDKARTREYGGSGIGLSIVKIIMDSHKQKYGVENRENGVEFWFDCALK